MQGMKFKVESEAHSEKIQKRLFELGYNWDFQKDGKGEPAHTYAEYLFAGIFGQKEITYCMADAGGALFYERRDAVETVYEDLFEKEPPLGIAPRNVWLLQRRNDLIKAIVRYIEAGEEPLIAWLQEAQDLSRELQKP